MGNSASYPLHQASADGDIAALKTLLASSEQLTGLTACHPAHGTALDLACRHGHADAAELLVDAGAAPNFDCEFSTTPLCSACQLGHRECVAILLKHGAQAALADSAGFAPLFLAAEYGHDECLRLLIEAGANVEQADREGVTPLYVAAQEGRDRCLSMLLAAGAAVDRPIPEEDGGGGARGRTALFAACSNGHASCVKILLERGAKASQADNEEWTPLHLASAAGHPQCAAAGTRTPVGAPLTSRLGDSSLTAAGACFFSQMRRAAHVLRRDADRAARRHLRVRGAHTARPASESRVGGRVGDGARARRQAGQDAEPRPRPAGQRAGRGPRPIGQRAQGAPPPLALTLTLSRARVEERSREESDRGAMTQEATEQSFLLRAAVVSGARAGRRFSFYERAVAALCGPVRCA
jgi:hypothetical protein